MTPITVSQLKAIAPNCTTVLAERFIPMLNATMDRYQINTPLRQCHFLAQILHESASLIYTHELADGSAYEGRKDLGNTQAGDGKKFKGRGFIQLTGRANYKAYGAYINKDLESNPDIIATEYPADVSGWFWMVKKLNTYADQDNINMITRLINGGFNGINSRASFLAEAKKVLMPA